MPARWVNLVAGRVKGFQMEVSVRISDHLEAISAPISSLSLHIRWSQAYEAVRRTITTWIRPVPTIFYHDAESSSGDQLCRSRIIYMYVVGESQYDRWFCAAPSSGAVCFSFLSDLYLV